MCKNVCRAITFINYHIPIRLDVGESIDTTEYATVGFFDGMSTERLELDYASDDLKALWKYSLKKTVENKGHYSFQNIFGLSNDEWNMRGQEWKWTDEQFWSEETNERYPLTFVVFLQLEDYMVGKGAIRKQCRDFNKKVDENLHGDGISYTYGTVDKNDFIVCLKCREYKRAVRAIKALHTTERKVIYSYSIFSVRRSVLEEIKNPQYGFLFEEKIESICLKGITNSFDSVGGILDKKYRTLCRKLVEQLYDGIEMEKEHLDSDDRKLYDILGDNDFRLIARHVNLGRLLSQYAPGGVLCYSEKTFPYYLFSSSLLLNTLNELSDEEENQVSSEHMQREIRNMEEKFVSPKCDELIKRIPEIQKGLLNGVENEDEKIVTFCQALFQLIQSLKVLESAPTKQYDFLSLYSPFAFLVQILEGKLRGVGKSEIAEEETIYEFIHTISMTLHGTLRTDIQFFQIRDFNAIVHYAPAKLRAYYAVWTLKLKDFYAGFGRTPHQYSFIFAPGLYKGTGVKELFTDYREQNRLMLMTVPERHLYIPRWLMIVIGHEVSHFVGRELRERPTRHELLLKMSAKILELEFQSYMYHGLKGNCGEREAYEAVTEEPDGLSRIKELLMEQAKEAEKRELLEVEQPYKYHSGNSKKIIEGAYRSMFTQYLELILDDYSTDIHMRLMKKIKDGSLEKNVEIAKECRKIAAQVQGIGERWINPILSEALNILMCMMSETFADMIAVLTLELSPEDYVFSFEKTEMRPDEMDSLGEDEVGLPGIRIAIVMESIDSVIKEKKTEFEKNAAGIFRLWGDNTLGKTKDSGRLSEVGRKLVSGALCYREGTVDWRKRIDKYQRRCPDPDVEKNKQPVSNFLLDKKIWGLLCEYLKDCGIEYINGLCRDEDLRKKRVELLRSYKKIAEGTEIDLMEEIEDFLHEWEQNGSEIAKKT